MLKYDLEVYDPEIRDRIKDWFAVDTWTVTEGCSLLAGFLPDPLLPVGYFTLDGMPLDEFPDLLRLKSRLIKIWNSNPDNPDVATPEQFIKWSVAKGFSPVWLDAVKEQGFYREKLMSNVQAEGAEVQVRLEPEVSYAQGSVKGITKQEVARAFEGCHYDHEQWNKYLASPAPWLAKCRTQRGTKSRKHLSLWDPVLIAVALTEIGSRVPIKKLDAVFAGHKFLRPWHEEWQDKSDLFR